MKRTLIITNPNQQSSAARTFVGWPLCQSTWIGAFLLILVAGALAAPTEVWVKWGTSTCTSCAGTMADPKVVATSTDFDNYINGQPTDTTIHFLAGTFTTVQGISTKAGWKLRGAGIDATTIKKDSPTDFLNAVIGPACCAQRNDGVEVSDLTVDCNLPATGNSTIHAVNLIGAQCKISRVKAINWGSRSTFETYVLVIKSYAGFGVHTNALIEDCIIGPPAAVQHTTGVTCISILGFPATPGPYSEIVGDGWMVGGEIRNCTIENIGKGTAAGQVPFCNALGVASIYGFKAINNRCINVAGNGFFSSGVIKSGWV